MTGRAINTVRYWLWRAAGTKGHLPRCRSLHVLAVSERTGDALLFGRRCAPGCPARAREGYRARRAMQRTLTEFERIQETVDRERVA